MKCFYYGFLGTLCGIIAGFGLVWVFQKFSAVPKE